MSKGYYRPTNTNSNWTESWQEQFDDGRPSEEILDELALLSCGIAPGASDECQRYARHVHVHLIAAFELGKHVSGQRVKELEAEAYDAMMEAKEEYP